MHSRKDISIKLKQARGLNLLALGFVLLYVLANVSFEAIHALHHEATLTTHTTADELDPCHRNIYHHDDTKGCNHKSHVTSTKHCALCQLQVTHDYDLAKNSVVTPDTTPAAYYLADNTLVIASLQVHLPARGPPAGI